jgi:hypothetical protein
MAATAPANAVLDNIVRGMEWRPLERIRTGFSVTQIEWESPSFNTDMGRGIRRVQDGPIYDAVNDALVRKLQRWQNWNPYRFHRRRSTANRNQISQTELQQVVTLINTINPVIMLVPLPDDILGRTYPERVRIKNRILISSKMATKLLEDDIEPRNLQATKIMLFTTFLHELSHIIMAYDPSNMDAPPINTPITGFGDEGGLFFEYALYGGACWLTDNDRTVQRLPKPGNPTLRIMRYPSWEDFYITIPPIIGTPPSPPFGSCIQYDRFNDLLARVTPWFDGHNPAAGQYWFRGPHLTRQTNPRPDLLFSLGNTLVGHIQP